MSTVIDFGRASRPGILCVRAAVGSYLFHWLIGHASPLVIPGRAAGAGPESISPVIP
jgi:hypothetical protein